jgi:hypothetical protein
MSVAGRLLKPLFEVTPADLPALEADGETTRRLLQVVFTVTECCQTTLFHSRFPALVPRMDAYDAELRGFAYEGAGVGLAALDMWLPWRRRTRDFVAGPGAPFGYAIYLGAGMAFARMHRDPERFRVGLGDPLFSWVVLDGYGFHEGFFAHRRTVGERVVPARLRGYARRAFDHGLGRSIWFTTGADPAGVVATIGTFPAHRHPDLWSGVGLACGYTGGVQRATIESLRTAAAPHLGDIAVGVAVAAKMRHQVDNRARHNDDACDVLCGMSSEAAAGVAETALHHLPPDGTEPAYEIWRQRIRAALAGATHASHEETTP